MEIFLDIFLFFWIEKKLILLLHIYSFEYMGLVLSLWFLESNDNAYSSRNCHFWWSGYLETSMTFFATVDFFFSLFKITWPGLTLQLKIWHGLNALKPCHAVHGKG